MAEKPKQGKEVVPARRSRSVEPSTSAASTPTAPPPPPPPPPPAPERLSVYSHIEGIQQIGQLRGLRSGRRRARFRGMRKANVVLKYAEALSILEPLLLEESQRLEEAHTLVAAAIEHFAITVTAIADQLDGKTHEHIYADRIEKFKRRAKEYAAKNQPEGADAETTEKVVLTPEEEELERKRLEREEAEEMRRLHEETVAAVAALSTADTRRERLPTLLQLQSDDSDDSD